MAESTWVALCPGCGERRFLWPATQDVNTGREPHATWAHLNGKDCPAEG